MRISDWSSDVCSSDLPITALGLLVAVETLPDLVRTVGNVAMDIAVTATVGRRRPGDAAPGETDALLEGDRLEEHTSELQSLMRISYADFCLQNKPTRTQTEYRA